MKVVQYFRVKYRPDKVYIVRAYLNRQLKPCEKDAAFWVKSADGEVFLIRMVVFTDKIVVGS